MNEIIQFGGTPGRRSRLLDLLDRPDDLREAIEDYLIGHELPDLVRELEALRPSAAGRPAIPAELLDRILSGGLAGLSDIEFQSLVSRPRTLLQLQKAVLLDGKDYWDDVIQRTTAPTDLPLPARDRPWYRSARTWAATVLVGSAASVVFVMATSGPVTKLEEVQRQLKDQAAQNASIQQELAALKRSHPPVDLTDLPEMDLPVARSEPADLPENDPSDLPKSRSNSA